MKEEVKKLITAEMFTDIFGIECRDCEVSPSGISIGYTKYSENAPIPYKTKSIYELKDKLEEWAVAMLTDDRMFKCTFGGKFKLWEAKFCDFDQDYEVELADTKLEALLKLYHAVKDDK